MPPPRIELGTEHYHCSIIPFNYSGNCFYLTISLFTVARHFAYFFINLSLGKAYGSQFVKPYHP